MNRLHVHIAVRDLDESIRFYSTLFNAEPSVSRPDYAKWLLDDPRVNFAISARSTETGIRHLGIQIEDANGLEAITARLQAAEAAIEQERDAHCCYARSNKTWVEDPQGIRWENFSTHGTIATYGMDAGDETASGSRPAAACCARSG